MESKAPTKSTAFDHYKSAGGIGIGTLAVWSTQYIDSVVLTDLITLSSPTLSYLTAMLINRLDKYFAWRGFKKWVQAAKSNLEKQLLDDRISEEKRKKLQEEYDELCELEFNGYKRQAKNREAISIAK